MNSVERENAIENFLEKWDEAMKAANEIPDFKWKFGVSIISNNSLVQDRIKTINGINDSFTRNNMGWTSSNN